MVIFVISNGRIEILIYKYSMSSDSSAKIMSLCLIGIWFRLNLFLEEPVSIDCRESKYD